MNGYNDVSEWLVSIGLSPTSKIANSDCSYSKNYITTELDSYNCIIQYTDIVSIGVIISLSSKNYKIVSENINVFEKYSDDVDLIYDFHDYDFIFNPSVDVDIEDLSVDGVIESTKKALERVKWVVFNFEHQLFLYKIKNNPNHEVTVNKFLDTRLYDESYVDKIKVNKDGIY